MNDYLNVVFAPNFQPDREYFCRWVIRFSTPTNHQVRKGDIHRFVLPRKIIVAILGDSFGSGEGIPSKTGDPWMTNNQGIKAHRSRRGNSHFAGGDR